MKVEKLAFLIVTSLAAFFSNAAAENSSLQGTAIKAIDKLFIEGDNEAFRQFVASNAARKTKGPGSAMKGLLKQPKDWHEYIDINEIIFFNSDDIDSLKKRYPDDMWEPNRIPAHLDDGLGCLVIIDGKEATKKGMMVFVLKDIEGKHLITYLDDN